MKQRSALFCIGSPTDSVAGVLFSRSCGKISYLCSTRLLTCTSTQFCPGLGPRSSVLALKAKLYEVVYAGAVPDPKPRSLFCAAGLAAVAMPAAERQKRRAETRQIFSHPFNVCIGNEGFSPLGLKDEKDTT